MAEAGMHAYRRELAVAEGWRENLDMHEVYGDCTWDWETTGCPLEFPPFCEVGIMIVRFERTFVAVSRVRSE